MTPLRILSVYRSVAIGLVVVLAGLTSQAGLTSATPPDDGTTTQRAVQLSADDVRAYSIFFRMIASAPGNPEEERAARAYAQYALKLGCESCGTGRAALNAPGGEERLLGVARLFGREIERLDAEARRLKGHPPATRDSVALTYADAIRKQLVDLDRRKHAVIEDIVGRLPVLLQGDEASRVDAFVRLHVKSKIRVIG